MNLNQRYPEQTETQSPKQSTYMNQLISELDVQLKTYSDLKDRLHRVGNSLKSQTEGEQATVKEQAIEVAPGYFSTLFGKIELLRKFNNDLEQTTIKLEQMF